MYFKMGLWAILLSE
ncbi:hypothetical protein F383_25081 [Gossypium arboreum]|uniref:Uncharacterized protein n=1 Tax=Gossypium arboreum TaxID=29729 RepID=A0A0B0MQD5_GOSAR|nr:hypothetical protein F383_25081 [Gossypium arboreum]